MMEYIKIVFFLCLVGLTSSCRKDALFDAGKTTTREISINDDFNGIEVKQMFDIVLANDTVNRIYVTCGENLQPQMDIYVKDGILYLDHHIKYNWSRNYEKTKLILRLNHFPRINVRKPEYITTLDTLKTNVFDYVDWEKFTEMDVTLNVTQCNIGMSSDNFGHYTIRGKATNATLWGWGSTFLYGEDMNIENCYIKHRGIGDLYVNVSNSLTVSLEATGNVYYKGNPTITIEQHLSTGKLIRLPNP